jgi:hypothetical protein
MNASPSAGPAGPRYGDEVREAGDQGGRKRCPIAAEADELPRATLSRKCWNCSGKRRPRSTLNPWCEAARSNPLPCVGSRMPSGEVRGACTDAAPLCAVGLRVPGKSGLVRGAGAEGGILLGSFCLVSACLARAVSCGDSTDSAFVRLASYRLVSGSSLAFR